MMVKVTQAKVDKLAFDFSRNEATEIGHRSSRICIRGDPNPSDTEKWGAADSNHDAD
jgi:hypothetical protein